MKNCKVRRGKYRRVPVSMTGPDGHGGMSLNLPEIPEAELQKILPKVSIVTITRNRGEFAGTMLHNWINLKYPRDRLEWIIVDDTDTDYPYKMRDYIPRDDPYITFHSLDNWTPIAEKRNIAVGLATSDYIVHMDDDDYYFPDHVLAKIRVILQYNCQGVHSMPFGVYDLTNGTSFVFEPDYESNNVAEASLAYRKDYWKQHKFRSERENGGGEGRAFIGQRFGQWLNLHFMFNMIAITHGTNLTQSSRRVEVESGEATISQGGDFFKIFPPSYQTQLENIRKIQAARGGN